MRIEWDESACCKHGQCEIAAPALFQLTIDGTLHVTNNVPSGGEDDAWAAADACPEQAITIVDAEENP